MNIKQTLDQAILKLKKTKNPSATLDAEVLLIEILKKPKEFLYTYPEYVLTKSQTANFKKLINRRVQHEPVAYLIGRKEFYSLDFVVDKNVLIPRPETEMLVEQLINYKLSAIDHKPTIYDIGTGSGCIAVTLKKILPKVNVVAIDISKSALNIAKKNAKKHKVKIKFIQSNLLEKIKNKKINIIVANLPYLKQVSNKIIKQKNNTLNYEPPRALWAKNNGLALYEKMFRQITDLKYQPQMILCEIDPRQTKQIKTIAKKHLPQFDCQIKKDLAGKNRVLILIKKPDTNSRP